MDIFYRLAEQKIKEAADEGFFEGLPGRGTPIKLDDDSIVPKELRLAYRVLKNANCLPPEVELRKNIFRIKDLLDSVTDFDEDIIEKNIKELNHLILKYNLLVKQPLSCEIPQVYREKILGKLINKKRK